MANTTNRDKTHCPKGHPYSGDNLYVRPNGKRECRQCRTSGTPPGKAPEESKSLSANSVYSDEDIELGLTLLARHDGNAKAAARNCKISAATLRRWRSVHPERYLEIQREVIPEIRARVSERALEIAEKAADVEQDALAKLHEELPNLEGRELANALRNVSTTKGISLTHANNFQAPPEAPKEATDIAAVIAGLQRLGIAKVVQAEQGEAEKVLDAEVVEDRS